MTTMMLRMENDNENENEHESGELIWGGGYDCRLVILGGIGFVDGRRDGFPWLPVSPDTRVWQ